jgi:hypothetical protein
MRCPNLSGASQSTSDLRFHLRSAVVKGANHYDTAATRCGHGCLAGNTGATLDQEMLLGTPLHFEPISWVMPGHTLDIANEQLDTSWPAMETFEVCLEAQASGVKPSHVLVGDLAQASGDVKQRRCLTAVSVRRTDQRHPRSWQCTRVGHLS